MLSCEPQFCDQLTFDTHYCCLCWQVKLTHAGDYKFKGMRGVHVALCISSSHLSNRCAPAAGQEGCGQGKVSRFACKHPSCLQQEQEGYTSCMTSCCVEGMYTHLRNWALCCACRHFDNSKPVNKKAELIRSGYGSQAIIHFQGPSEQQNRPYRSTS